MPEWTDSDEGGIGVLPEKKTRLEKPKLFKVILHNDDFTTMDFVVFILVNVFMRSELEAFAVMLTVHNEGSGVAGIYPHEIGRASCRERV